MAHSVAELMTLPRSDMIKFVRTALHREGMDAALRNGKFRPRIVEVLANVKLRVEHDVILETLYSFRSAVRLIGECNPGAIAIAYANVCFLWILVSGSYAREMQFGKEWFNPLKDYAQRVLSIITDFRMIVDEADVETYAKTNEICIDNVVKMTTEPIRLQLCKLGLITDKIVDTIRPYSSESNLLVKAARA